MLDNLRAEGIGPEDIDTVILTHGHPDHIGGSSDAEGKPTFPDARYVMWKGEWDFWTSESTLGKLEAGQLYGPELGGMMAMFARYSLSPVQSQIDVIERETEIVAGVHAIPAPGHTPGHMALIISSGEEQALHLADTVVHPIHLEQSEWYSLYDLEPELAVTTRQKLLDRVASEGVPVLSYHSPSRVWGTSPRRKRGGSGSRWSVSPR